MPNSKNVAWLTESGSWACLIFSTNRVVPDWLSLDRTVTIEEEPDEGGDINWVLYAGIGLLILVVIVVVAMLLKKRKGKKADGGAGESSGGMEGMAPPE